MVDAAEVLRVAALAKLDFGSGGVLESEIVELSRMTEVLDGIKQFPLDDKDYPLDMELVNTYRADVAQPSLSRAEMLMNAPESEAGCFSVPKIIGGDE